MNLDTRAGGSGSAGRRRQDRAGGRRIEQDVSGTPLRSTREGIVA
ncbi:hypothetical protein AB5I41_10945 [Sphingomonas sp. MMS24-JH45]